MVSRAAKALSPAASAEGDHQAAGAGLTCRKARGRGDTQLKATGVPGLSHGPSEMCQPSSGRNGQCLLRPEARDQQPRPHPQAPGRRLPFINIVVFLFIVLFIVLLIVLFIVLLLFF